MMTAVASLAGWSFPASRTPIGVLLAALFARSDPAALRPADQVAAVDERGDICDSRNGDGDAYARLIKRYQSRVAARMWRFTRDRHEYEELVHEVFVEAYFSLSRYREMNSFGAWLDRIATRVGYRFWKRRQRVPKTVPLDDWRGGATTDRPTPQQAADRLGGLMEKLNPRDRLVLTLLYWEGYSVSQTARHTGWTQAMVKVQAHRARARLKKLLERR